MTFAEFKALVRENLPHDDQREGAQSFIERNIRFALLDLQSHIPQLQVGQENLYTLADLTAEGSASRGTIPLGAVVKEAYRVDYDEENPTTELGRVALASWRWEDRFSLVQGCRGTNESYITIDPRGQVFYTAPKIEDALAKIALIWDGKKVAYQETEQVPFGEQAAEAVSFYVKSKLGVPAESDLAIKQAYWVDYLNARKLLYVEAREPAFGGTKP